ncbi:MAG: F0F1 ATP synthase subunit A [Opitutales bacterium]
MPGKLLSLFAFLLFILPASAFGAEGGVSPYGYTLFEIPLWWENGEVAYGLPITNAFLTSIVMATLLVVLIRSAVRTPQMIPNRSQAAVETVIEAIRGQMQPIVGKDMVKPSFPIVASLFFFILIHNWSGLLPGVGAFGFLEDGHLEYWFRPANTDVNNTIALAVAAHLVWLYLIFKYAGLKSISSHIFGNKADKATTGPSMWLFLTVIFFVVGIIELISIGIRPLTLSMRLFGNIFGGENMLEAVYGLVGPGFYWLAVVPFYFLELLVGFLQALVFALLTCVYIGLLCNHDEEHH